MYHSARTQEQASKLSLPDDINYLISSERVIKATPRKRISVAVLCIDLVGATNNNFTGLEHCLQALIDTISVDNFITFSDTGQLWITLYTEDQARLTNEVVRLHQDLTLTGDPNGLAMGCFTGVCFAQNDGAGMDTLLRQACAAALYAREDANLQGELRFFRATMTAS